MALNTQSLQPIINFLWTVADDVLVNTYQKGKYKDVILPMVVIRRLDLLLEPTKDQVLKTFSEYKDKLQNLDSLLTNNKHGSGLAFYNTSPFTLKKLLQDPKNLRSNFENYLNGFSDNVQDIINKFKFRNEIETLDEAQILFSLIEKFCSPKVELHPDKLPPLAMGYVYEDLVRRFNEENNEEAGEHFTPREIIDLMTHIVFMPVKEKIKNGTYLIYDPCVGSGGMLTTAKNFILNSEGPVKSTATVHLYGQESTPFIFATCKSDMLIKGEDPNKIAYGSTLSAYGFPSDLKFDFMLTNPPYGKTWAPDKKALGVGEKGKIIDRRFILNGSYKQEAVTSRVNDGQLMFVLHMLSKMKDTELGSRIASVHNNSALITGDAGSGESEIRKYIIDNDLLECVIALPTDIFYNTGLPSFIMLFSNRKSDERKGKVQLIDATSERFFRTMNKGLGSKQKMLTESHVAEVANLYLNLIQNEYSKVFDKEEFLYYKVPIESPLKDADGTILKDSKNRPLPDTNLRDYEYVPFKDSIEDYFKKNVEPYNSEAWIDYSAIKTGCEIPLSKLLFRYSETQTYEEIIKQIHELDLEIDSLITAQASFDNLISKHDSLKPSGVDWIKEIPETWNIYSNRELFSERIERGGTADELLSVTQDRGVIKQKDDSKKDTSNEDKSMYKRVEVGDIVYNKMRMWQGAVGYSQFSGIVSPAYVVLKPREKVFSKFFYYLFKTKSYIEQSKKYSYGLCDDMNSLRYEDFRNMTSACPDFDTQQKLTSVIEDRFAKLDSLISKKGKLVELLRNSFTGSLDISLKNVEVAKSN